MTWYCPPDFVIVSVIRVLIPKKEGGNEEILYF